MIEFDFELQHRAGTAHGNADALSRKYSAEDVDKQPCVQCRRRGFYDEDLQDACQAQGGVMAVYQGGGCEDDYYEMVE